MIRPEEKEKQMDAEQLEAFSMICKALENLPIDRQRRVMKAVGILLEIELK
jgi:hypothetical protein